MHARTHSHHGMYVRTYVLILLVVVVDFTAHRRGTAAGRRIILAIIIPLWWLFRVVTVVVLVVANQPVPLGQVKQGDPPRQIQARQLRHGLAQGRDGRKARRFLTQQPAVPIERHAEARMFRAGFPPQNVCHELGLAQSGHFRNHGRFRGFAPILLGKTGRIRVGWVGHLDVQVGMVAQFDGKTLGVAPQGKLGGRVGRVAKDANLTANGTAKRERAAGNIVPQDGGGRVNAAQLVDLGDTGVVGRGHVLVVGGVRFAGAAKEMRGEDY